MKRSSFFFFLLIGTTFQLCAQEFRTDESIGKQLKGNSQPGMQYAPAGPSAPAQVKPHLTMAEEIRRGKFGKVQGGGSSVPAPAASRRVVVNDAGLPSSRSSGEAARTLKPAKAPSVQLPSQDGGGSNPATPAPKPIEVNKLPVKKNQQ